MDIFDRSLEEIVAEWLASAARDRAELSMSPETVGGGAGFNVEPRNADAAPIELWVADDGKHIGFAVGVGSWWPDEVLLDKAAMWELLSAVAAGHVGEEIRHVGDDVLVRNGYVELAPSQRLTYHHLSLDALLSLSDWEWIAYDPY
jgi:hypothetical protein